MIAAVEAFVLALVPALAYAFGWSADATQMILGVAGPFVAVLSALFVRRRVSPSV